MYCIVVCQNITLLRFHIELRVLICNKAPEVCLFVFSFFFDSAYLCKKTAVTITKANKSWIKQTFPFWTYGPPAYNADINYLTNPSLPDRKKRDGRVRRDPIAGETGYEGCQCGKGSVLLQGATPTARLRCVRIVTFANRTPYRWNLHTETQYQYGHKEE